MVLSRSIARSPQYICRQCIRSAHSKAKYPQWKEINSTPHEAALWNNRAREIKSGSSKSVLRVLEERGFIKDVAGSGGRPSLEWLLTEKPIGAYVGVDPTAPSLHVGHLLPLMVLYWLHMFGYGTVTLLGGGTVRIGDPSGRKTARERQDEDARTVYTECIHIQLDRLWTNVRALAEKHNFPMDVTRRRVVANNDNWLRDLNAIDLMRSLGSGMRLAEMLNRDSVRMRMESGTGMSFAEFSYPLFQGYDFWTLYDKYGVQLQIGGSDQHGNICAGIDAVKYMRSDRQEPSTSIFGITTPLLTTSSGEKFGKSAGNAIWLDKDMFSSFDLYQYFLRTADADVERYLKLFTFLPLEDIRLLMLQQQKYPEKRTAQRVLAKEFVELAHGGKAAKEAEMEHQDAFKQGTQFFPLRTLRKMLGRHAAGSPKTAEEDVMKYKRAFMTVGSNATHSSVEPGQEIDKIVVIPRGMVERANFGTLLHASGLVPSKSEGQRLIQKRGAYVARQNRTLSGNSADLEFEHIPSKKEDVHPIDHYLVDWDVLVLRAGKTKLRICRLMPDDQFDSLGLDCPGWEDFKARLAQEQQIKDAAQ